MSIADIPEGTIQAAYLAPEGLEIALAEELQRAGRSVLAWHGPLALSPEPPFASVWALDIWTAPRDLPVVSIKQAAASLRAALTISAGDADLFTDLGRADAMLRNWKEAVLDLNAAIALRRDAGVLVLRASAHRALKDYRAALADLNAALAIRPGNGDALLERGLLRRDLGDIGGARKDFAAAQKNGSTVVKRDAAAALDAIKE